ncbi:MAG: PAS domain-containing protein [Geobacter sp.]|nr:PAS domain-containing protein [Geobacter sp.]
MTDEMKHGEREQRLLAYVRDRVNHLLTLTGTAPMPPEEFAGGSLIERDPLGVVSEGIAELVDHLQQTNDSLARAHEEIQTILATAGAGILVVDRDMRIQAYNQKFREQLSASTAELIGQPCCRVLCNQETKPERCTFQRIFETKSSFIRRDWYNNNRFYDVAGTPIKHRDGEISRVVLVYFDVTDRRRTEEILMGNEEMYCKLFNLSDDLVFHLAPDGAIVYANPASNAALGRQTADFDILSIEEILHPSAREETLRQLQLAAESRQSIKLSTVFLSGDGTSVPVSGVISSNVNIDRHIITCGIFRRQHPGS